ncbi:enoyl-CoA hydratase [Burkholderia lata]|uniref:Enoyl-CoA hydratase n=1 Tax=Burkholderia lata (strain ATCC 17760 / DSM 23089 / LMG 22485 / NCIMB 9086 / R18194 / 383) TaxID=482957 RepID=A0A6P2KRW2_BURL3|nr:enoyl-CoA hydratase/isomerase family protein [Burkholderia lata]VWB60811.1 enoyl-CoA hydratase [Burkholderia lata]
MSAHPDRHSPSDAESSLAADPVAQPPSLAIDGAVATIRLHRPASHNRIEPDDVAVLRGHLDRLDADPAVRVIVFESSGKSFSAGFDLTRFGKAVSDRRDTQDSLFEALCDAIENTRAVTIARLHAPVYGGATDLALSCDFRIGVDGIRMFMPAARLGLHYYGHGIRRWVSRLGLGAAKKLFLTSRTIDAAEMLRIGFLDALVAPDSLDAEIRKWTEELLAMAPIPVVSMKAILNQAARGEYDDVAAFEAFKYSLGTDDMAEALAAFAENRKPTFQGE